MSETDEARALAWARDHPGAVLTAVPFVLASLKVVAVSSFSLPVQLAMLSSSSIAAIVLGTAISLTPTIAAIVFVNGLARLVLGWPRRLREWTLLSVGAAIYLVLIPFVSRALPALIAAGIVTFLVAELIGPFSFVHPWRGLRDKLLDNRVLALAAAIAVVLTSFNAQPWVPVERLQLTEETRVGYVLSEDSGIQFLDHRTRVVETLSTDDVVSRDLCRLRDARRSIVELVLGREAHGSVVGPCGG